MKRKTLFVAILVSLVMLSGCHLLADKSEEKPTQSKTVQQIKAPGEEVRLKFNQIKLGHLATDFKGGSTPEEMIAMFGQPMSQEKIPAGEKVTLDSFTWQFDQVTVGVRFFENSAIARTISNFAFIREARIDLADFEAIPEEESYQKIIEQLGQPDVLSESISSDNEHIQAIWTSNLIHDKSNSFIELTFENNILIKKVQNGLKKDD